ncbi:MAG: FAD-binding protein [Legionella sp.]|nr:FAD-binding protein [Legionella sp.]
MSKYQNLPKLGYFNAIPAAIIDKVYREKPKGFFGKTINLFQTRLAFLLLFIPLSLVDIVVSAALAMTYSFRSFFTSDETQDARLAQQKAYTTQFSKSLFAVFGILIGLISPKLVALYFIPEKQTKTTGVHAGGDYYNAPNAVLKKPKSIEELQHIIKQAAADGKKIMPKGAGFSQGRQFLPEGDKDLIVIDLSELNTVEIHSDDKTAIVGAGAIWSEVKVEANKFKLALKVMQASDVFSVGGSLGTNIHGWNIHDGMLSTVVSSITIVNAQGELQTLTPEDSLFHNVTGGLGLYGIIVKATINLTDNELLKEKGVEIAPADYADHFYNVVQKDEQTRMHLYRLSLDPNNLLGSGVAVSYVKEDDQKPIKDNLNLEREHGTRFDRVMINAARHYEFIRKKYWDMERTRLLANDSPAMSVNRIMQPPIKAMFNPATSESEWLQEFFLPADALAEFLKQLSSLLSVNDVRLLNASVRFVKQNDKSPLSYAHDGDRFAVVLCFNQALEEEAVIKAKKWIRQAQHLAIKQDGAYYLPYQHVSSPEDFNTAYPHVAEALVAKKEVDPENLFASGLFQKYMEQKPATTNHFKVIMATAESKTKFAGFLKNVLCRIDSDKFFALMEDILLYNDSHEEIYTELSTRLPEIFPDSISDLSHVLDSLAAIKTDLAEQAYALLPSNKKTINGLVEVGYPGRFVNGFKKHYKITGEIVAVYEQQSLTDYVQTGFPRPYDRFEKLDYSKPNLNNLADNSADVITCYVGLHHFEDDELEVFLADVRRVLRPQGHFLVVDHDVVDDEIMSMAHMAHTIFNIATGVSVEEEMNETRKFNPMQHWKELLEKHDLGYAVTGPDVPLVRHGDPSRNRMVSFANKKPVLQLVEELAEQEHDMSWRDSEASDSKSSLQSHGMFQAGDSSADPSDKLVDDDPFRLNL